MNNLYTCFESFISEFNNISYEYETEGEDFHYITAYSNDIDVANSEFEEKMFDNEYFKRCGWSKNDINNVFGNENKYIKINTVVVKPNFRRMGIAKKLMQLTMDKIKELNYNIVYLYAYPMGNGKKTSTQELIDFYKSYGFEVVLQNDHGAEMYLKLETYNENILVPRNIEGRTEKLRQENIKILQQTTIKIKDDEDILLIDKTFDIPANLSKCKVIKGNVYIDEDIDHIPEWLKNVTIYGDFIIAGNTNIKNLINSPKRINGGIYHCSDCELISLEGCTKIIFNGSFDCSYNNLESLKGGPKKVTFDYICTNNSNILQKPKDLICGTFKNK